MKKLVIFLLIIYFESKSQVTISGNQSKDFLIEVAKGRIPKHSVYHLFSRNSNVGTAAEDCTPMSTTYTTPLNYRTVSVVSSSANDALLGTGMRVVELTGVTINGIQTETLALNGLTPVVSTYSYACILESEGISYGSTLNNVGNITITATVDLTVQNIISAGINEAYSGVFMCPPGHKAYLLSWTLDAQNNSNTTQVDAFLLKKNGFSNGWQQEDNIHLYLSSTSSRDKNYNGSIFIDANRFIKTQVISTNTTTDASVSYQILLIKD